MSIKASNAGDADLTATPTSSSSNIIVIASTVDSSEIAFNFANESASLVSKSTGGSDEHMNTFGQQPGVPGVQVAVDSGPAVSPEPYGIRITEEQSGDIKLRNLVPADIPELKELCGQWFPIEYPNFWYADITSNKKFCSLVATHQGRIIGLIVADVKLKLSLDVEDFYILSSRKFAETTQLTYILSLGVLNEYRRLGIASLLLDTLIHHLNMQTSCKAIYLHVLASNAGAIKFYEKRSFQRRAHLPKYYTINGQAHDGYTYVLYMNGGEPPLLFGDLVSKSWSKIRTLCNCNIACRLYLYMVDFFRQSHSLTKDQYRIS